MAEIWPRLRKKLQEKKKTKSGGTGRNVRKGSKGATNPYATIGLEKFATLLEEIKTKQPTATLLVERTASSLSAARSISRSAQEWTASTLVRTAGRCSSDNTKALQCAPPVEAPSTPVGKLQPELEKLCEAPTAPAEDLQRDLENLSQDSQAQGCQEEVSTSNSDLPLGVRLPIRRWRLVASKSAFVMLVALGAFLSARAGKVGKPFAAALSFTAVVRIWHRWKVSTRFIFSSMALYFLTPLRSYLMTRIPKRLTVVLQNPEPSQSAASEGCERDRLAFQVVAPSLLPIPESIPSSESLNPVTFPPIASKNVAGSSSRRLAKKISSRLKRLTMRRPSPSSVSVSESSSSSFHAPPSPTSSSASSHRRKCPFSRKTGDIAEAQASESSRMSSQHGSRSKCRLLRRHHSSETVSLCNSTSKSDSWCGRRLSSETLEQYNQASVECSIASISAYESKCSTSSSHEHEAAPVAWPMVGLLVTLLFLLVGRVPAIVATSLFFVVVSPHSRARDRRESRAYREAAARKLHRSPPPGGRALSPPPRNF